MIRRTRLSRRRIGRGGVVGGSLAITVLPLALLPLAGLSVDTSLGIAGLVFGAATLGLTELREREPPARRISYLGQEDATFDANIIEGLRDTLSGNLPYVLRTARYSRSLGDLVAWQVREMGSPDFEGSDAVVILPCHDDQRIWQAVMRLSSRGIKVVVMDFEPPQDLFIDQRLPIPAFVSSNFIVGGALAGGLLAEHLDSHSSAAALVLTGPPWSRPGSGRSSRVLLTLAGRGHLSRTEAFELFSWDPHVTTPRVLEHISHMFINRASSLVVFCGDDRLLADIDRGVTANPALIGRVSLVGYDGALGPDGSYLVRSARHCIGTIDTQPRLQGEAAGRVLLEEYRNEVAGGLSRVLVEPRSVTSRELD